MKRQVKVWGVLLMIVLLSSAATAVQETAAQPVETTNQVAIGAPDATTTASAATAVQETAVQPVETMNQVVIGAQDVITASDAGGGSLSSRDLLIIIAVCVGLLVLIAVI